MTQDPVHLDAMIFGGGIAGLWTLHEILATGRSAILVEPSALGSGQTIASQGIIHGGLKYTLQGLLNRSAEAVRDMPAIWRECLSGARQPDLSKDGLRAPSCHLWRAGTLLSHAGMMGAKIGLRVAPVSIRDDDRPPILRRCPGTVARLDEQVIDVGSVIQQLLRASRGCVAHVQPVRDADLRVTKSGAISASIKSPSSDRILNFRPRRLILTAGAGNAQLREQLGLPTNTMQLRPLHMLLVRGPSTGADALPELHGHCVEGTKTRVTVTSAGGDDGYRIWQVGGELAERGVTRTADELMRVGRKELTTVLPELRTQHLEWASYRVDRAEPATGGGARPDDASVRVDGNVITAWPTKLALAPRIADLIIQALLPRDDSLPTFDRAAVHQLLSAWPEPPVAEPPWRLLDRWVPDQELAW